MRSLSHSQAAARSNNTMFRPYSGSGSRPTSVLYNSQSSALDDADDGQLDDAMSEDALVSAHPTAASTVQQDKENVNNSSIIASGSKTPLRSPSTSSLLHHFQPFKYALSHSNGTTTPLSSSPTSTPNSPSKHARRRSSVHHPRSPSARSSSSRPSSIANEAQLMHHHALHKAVEAAISSGDEHVCVDLAEDADNEGPAKQPRKEGLSNASHTGRRLSASSPSVSNEPSTPPKMPTKTPSASVSPMDDSPSIKDRRARRGSNSSKRSRQNSQGSTLSGVNSTPRSRGSSFREALDTMHIAYSHTSHAQSSSLSNRSDTTLHPADFTFSPPGTCEEDVSANAGNRQPKKEDNTWHDELGTLDSAVASECASPSAPTRTSQLVIAIIKVRDFAFPVNDPRFIGEALPPTPIDIPEEDEGQQYGSWVSPNSLNGQLALGPSISQTAHQQQCEPSPSLSLMSSSSSSSLSSSFTPPPFGSFGYGHHYHYAGSGTPRYDASRQRDSAASQLRLPPGGSWSTWDGNSLADGVSGSTSGQAIGTPTSTTSGNSNNSGRMWNFVTDHTSAVPSNLLDSALSIEDFRDEDLDDDDDVSYDRDSNPGAGGVGYEAGSQQQPVETTEEQRASDESFASLPTGTGIYRVQYTFAAEAPQEMDVNEGDHVRVWQQLCDGWVLGAKVVQKSPSSDTQDGRVEYAETCNGLVPQSYLMFSHTVTLTSSENDETSNGVKATCYYFP